MFDIILENNINMPGKTILGGVLVKHGRVRCSSRLSRSVYTSRLGNLTSFGVLAIPKQRRTGMRHTETAPYWNAPYRNSATLELSRPGTRHTGMRQAGSAP